jgi:acetyl esterase/lipase
MIKRILCSTVLLSSFSVTGIVRAAGDADHEVIPLYSGVAPGSEDWKQKEGSLDLEDTRFKPANPDTIVWNVTRPTLTVFRPAPGKGNGTAIVVAPGGGFRVLSYKNEGLRVAQFLADRGYTAFVLKYRLHEMPGDPAAMRQALDQMLAGAPPAGLPPPAAGPPRITLGPVEKAGISDGVRAVELVRSRAKEFGVVLDHVGIIGFSAGGAVSGNAAIADTGRPDFVGVIYADVAGTIPKGAPTAFLAAAADDPLSAGMPDLFTRWRAAGAQAELHIYAKGNHGFGTAKQGLPVDHWLESFDGWLVQQGFGAKASH